VNTAPKYGKVLLGHVASEQILLYKSFYWKHEGSSYGATGRKHLQLSVNNVPSIKVTSTSNIPLQVDLQHSASDPQLQSSFMQDRYKHMGLSYKLPSVNIYVLHSTICSLNLRIGYYQQEYILPGVTSHTGFVSHISKSKSGKSHALLTNSNVR
jgi:hypothetical protein